MPLVAIVGRPNVGKSTFFNRLTESRKSIVHDEPGVTRDRVYGEGEWNGRTFSVVDTGGYVENSSEPVQASITEQVRIAVVEADVILFMVDVLTGITDLDLQVAELLRKTAKPTFIVANKSDNPKIGWGASEFYEFGLGDVYPISSVNGTGTGDLLDAVVAILPSGEEEVAAPDALRLAIVGRPNVGKSSLTNAFLGEERSIVNDESGTTRDSIDAHITYHGKAITLVDTAGLRRKSRVRENVEFYSLLRTQRAIESCRVAVLLLDAETGLESQDIKVLKRAEELNKGMIIAVNKWDALEKESNTARDMARAIRERLRTMNYIPILFISALTKKRINTVLDTALDVQHWREYRVPTSELNELMQAAFEAHHPPSYRDRHVKIKYVSQVKTAPPVFAFFCNYPQGIQESYRRYLENKIREKYPFTGVPVTISFRKK